MADLIDKILRAMHEHLDIDEEHGVITGKDDAADAILALLSADTAPPPAEGEGVLADLEAVCDELHDRWDRDMKPGKLLQALRGNLRNYDPRVTRIRTALSAPPPAEGEAEPIKYEYVSNWAPASPYGDGWIECTKETYERLKREGREEGTQIRALYAAPTPDTGVEDVREECAKIVEQTITEMRLQDNRWARAGLLFAAHAVRRGRHLTAAEKLENFKRAMAEDDEAALSSVPSPAREE